MGERLRLWLERGCDGFCLRDAATGEPVRWEDPRIRVVAGRRRRPTGRGARRSRPSTPAGGSRSSPEPENEHDPNAVAIWNERADAAARLRPAAIAPELRGDEQAVSLWRVDGGLRVLIAPADAWLGHASSRLAAVAYEFKLPDLGEGLTEGEIARWLVAEGQEIAEDDPLVEIQTDKTTVEIPSPAAGTVARILVAEGEVVPVGTVLVVIGDGGADGRRSGRRRAGSDAETPALGVRACPQDERVQATPLVRRIAQELGVDLASCAAPGPNGRITEDDVRGAGDGELVRTNTSPSEERRVPLRGSPPPDRRAPDARRTARSRPSRSSRSATSPASTCSRLVPLALQGAAAALLRSSRS